MQKVALGKPPSERLTFLHVSLESRQTQQCGDGQREGGYGGWVDVGKAGCGVSVRVSTIKIKIFKINK